MIARGLHELRVRDVMTPDPIAASPNDTLRQLARLFALNEISGCPVVDEHNRVVGVVSKTDLLDWMLAGGAGLEPQEFFEQLADTSTVDDEDENVRNRLGVVRDFMSPQPLTATPDDSLVDVADKMAEHRVHRVVVVNPDGTAAGVVTSFDLLKVFARGVATWQGSSLPER